jgi:hypothetical protein
LFSNIAIYTQKNKLFVMKKILVLFLLTSALFTSCKKNPDRGKIKYQLIFNGTGYSNIDISYTNEFGNTNTINNNTSANWTKEIEGTKDKCYGFDVSGDPTGTFEVTARMYWEGKVVDEVTSTSFFNGQNYQYFFKDCNYCIYDIP